MFIQQSDDAEVLTDQMKNAFSLDFLQSSHRFPTDVVVVFVMCNPRRHLIWLCPRRFCSQTGSKLFLTVPRRSSTNMFFRACFDWVA